MILIKELQIKITMSNYNQRSSSYSSNYDYLFLDNLLDSVLNISLKKIQSKLWYRKILNSFLNIPL